MKETTILRTPRKGEVFRARYCVLNTIDSLLAYKRGRMKGIDWTRAKEWEDALITVIDEWQISDNDMSNSNVRIDKAVLELADAVVEYSPVKEDDLRGF